MELVGSTALNARSCADTRLGVRAYRLERWALGVRWSEGEGEIEVVLLLRNSGCRSDCLLGVGRLTSGVDTAMCDWSSSS